MDLPLISVVIPTYNRCEMLRDALESLLQLQTNDLFSYEIVVVDNASSDATKATVESVAADAPIPVRYMYNDVPGDAPSRNYAVARTDGEWLAFFDDDQLALPDWLLKLFEAAQQTGSLAIGGAVQLHLPQEILDGLGPYVRRTSFRETDGTKLWRFTNKRLPGCANAMVARKVFELIGNFDTAMIWGGSDSDFFLRARKAGFDLYFTPYAVIRHRIPINRFTPEYFRWDAQQGCDALACHDCKYKGRAMLVPLALARIAQGAFVLFPGLIWAKLRGNRGAALDNRVRLWRIVGYCRRTLALLAPSLFPQTKYFAHLTFRKGRTIGKQKIEAEGVASDTAVSTTTV